MGREVFMTQKNYENWIGVKAIVDRCTGRKSLELLGGPILSTGLMPCTLVVKAGLFKLWKIAEISCFIKTDSGYPEYRDIHVENSLVKVEVEL